jgi:hypothetical protein
LDETGGRQLSAFVQNLQDELDLENPGGAIMLARLCNYLVPEVPIPLVARYVAAVASRRGWSLGRTISWLRTEPEVHRFREGMAVLLAAVESRDDVTVNAILAELDQAAHAWPPEAGSRPARRTVSLLVLVDQLLRGAAL